MVDDPKGGNLRSHIYQRLRNHFQFQNQFILFPIGHRNKYSINIFGRQQEQANFINISNLFAAKTIDACYEHDGEGKVGGIKNDDNQWNLEGHQKRIIKVNEDKLALFAKLYDGENTPALEARLPALHSQQLLSVLEKFAAQPKRLKDLEGQYYSTVMFDETNSRKDGTIKRKTCFPESYKGLIISGPHLYVGNPLYKTPREICTEKGHYDVLDLTNISNDYLPRTNYIPACDAHEYQNRIPRVTWIEQGESESKKVTEYYRLAFRGMLPPANERTLIGAVIPKGEAHINGCRSYAFADRYTDRLIVFASFTCSLAYDFLVKSTGKTNLHQTLDDFPPP